MKRFFCLLLALCLLFPAALAEEWEGDGDDWTLYESPFGWSLWYDAGLFLLDDGRADGAVVICPRDLYTELPQRDEKGGIAAPRDPLNQAVLRIAALMEPAAAPGWTPPPEGEPSEREMDLSLPYECTTVYVEDETIGRYTLDNLFVLLPDAFFYAYISYPEDDPDGWGEMLWDVLCTLEFPAQPAVNDDFRLDFFRDDADGTPFTDVILDEDAVAIVLLPYRTMTDFRLETPIWDEENFTVSDALTVYTAASLSPGDNLRIFVYFEDILPTLRARYTDADGMEQCWYFTESGRDGSLLLMDDL